MSRKKQYIKPSVTIKKLLDYAADHDSRSNNKYFSSDRLREEMGARFEMVLKSIYKKYNIGRVENLKPEYFEWYLASEKSGVTCKTKKYYVDMIDKFYTLAKDLNLIPQDTGPWIDKNTPMTAPTTEFLIIDPVNQSKLLEFFYIRDPKFYVMLSVQKEFALTNKMLCYLQTADIDILNEGRIYIEGEEHKTDNNEVIDMLTASVQRAQKLKKAYLFANNFESSAKRLLSAYDSAIRAAQEYTDIEYPSDNEIFSPPADEPEIKIAVKRMAAYGIKAYQNAADKTKAKEEFFATTQTAEDYTRNFLHIIQTIQSKFTDIKRISDLKTENFAWYQMDAYINRGNLESTIDKNRAIIRKFEKIAIRMKWKDPSTPAAWLPESPVGSLKRSESSYPLDDDEVIALLDYLRHMKNKRWYLMAAMQICFGLRRKEVCSLRSNSINYKTCTLHLTAADKTKGGRPRSVTSHDDIAPDILKEVKKYITGTPLVFAESNNDAADLLYKDYADIIRQSYKTLGIDHTKTHDLRRTFAKRQLTWYIITEGKTDVEALAAVSQDLGHGDVRMAKGLINKYITAPEDTEAKSDMEWLRGYCKEVRSNLS